MKYNYKRTRTPAKIFALMMLMALWLPSNAQVLVPFTQRIGTKCRRNYILASCIILMALSDVLSVCCSVQIDFTIMTRMFDKCRHCRFVLKLENF